MVYLWNFTIYHYCCSLKYEAEKCHMTKELRHAVFRRVTMLHFTISVKSARFPAKSFLSLSLEHLSTFYTYFNKYMFHIFDRKNCQNLTHDNIFFFFSFFYAQENTLRHTPPTYKYEKLIPFNVCLLSLRSYTLMFVYVQDE